MFYSPFVRAIIQKLITHSEDIPVVIHNHIQHSAQTFKKKETLSQKLQLQETRLEI